MISLQWIDSPRRDDGLPYTMWFLCHQSGRVLATIEGPTVKEFCNLAILETRQERRYINLDGAKEWCEREARTILGEELKQQALRRKSRRSTRA